ncbi:MULTISPECIES: type II toxin-antitoxin system PemI/MazE family antitoxin [unclassified Enterococcus]|uniref:type II toxin-antitoxin system PemI/MazE family antitoxin n=1 Tax=unclassified Enterococcus TaxID=2608891 RepID=UPI001A933C6C|nr:AbrB family transcriptional regulator [Enterococcus sp. DIV1298c]MBO1300041.1 AbrB family transcriptional regulator [Enterococcus sp. DIV1271a]
MLTTKSRRQRSSVIIDLPPENQVYIVVYSEDGTITLIPKIKDPFEGKEKAEYYEKDQWQALSCKGKEIVF